MFDVHLIDELLQPRTHAEFDRERNHPYVLREFGVPSVNREINKFHELTIGPREVVGKLGQAM